MTAAPELPITESQRPTRKREPTPADGPAPRGQVERYTVFAFVFVPLLAVVAAVPLAWGWGLSWTDIVIATVFYVISGLGITGGFHRHFTHGSFRANRPLRIALAVAGSLAIEGSVIKWVADHRRHHKYSDAEGDAHSPWRFGDDWKSVAEGLYCALMAWRYLADKRPSRRRFAPDLLRDEAVVLVD